MQDSEPQTTPELSEYGEKFMKEEINRRQNGDSSQTTVLHDWADSGKKYFTDNTTGKFEWGTPQRFFDELNSEFGFTLDVCAAKELAKCPRYYDQQMDGLKQDWTGETCWMNPPYGAAIGMWLKKAYESHATVVCLVPSRTDNKWWHQWVMMADEIRFVKGRLRFQGAGDGAKFPSAIMIFRGDKQLQEIADEERRAEINREEIRQLERQEEWENGRT